MKRIPLPRSGRCRSDGISTVLQRAATSRNRQARVKDKHRIRKIFHPQLKVLWHERRELKELLYRKLVRVPREENTPDYIPHEARWDDSGKPWVQYIADEYSRDGFRFVPLVREANGFECSLDILFLRRERPGSIVRSGGDIDNRIKVLFDALRLTRSKSELGDASPAEGEDPFFCLLEDDSLITDVRVTTDQLLTPLEADDAIHDVVLIIKVKLTSPDEIFASGRLA